MAIPRGVYDVLIDRMVTALEDFSGAQELITPGVAFNVRRDQTRPPTAEMMPLVVVWLEGLDPTGQGSSHAIGHDVARINVDCYARGLDTDCDGLDDETAMSRLYYLQEQVRYALFKLINRDFGFSSGTIGRKKWPRWLSFQADLREPESEVVAGRWVLEVEYAHLPEDIVGEPLNAISVDADRWSALYNFGGD